MLKILLFEITVLLPDVVNALKSKSKNKSLKTKNLFSGIKKL